MTDTDTMGAKTSHWNYICITAREIVSFCAQIFFCYLHNDWNETITNLNCSILYREAQLLKVIPWYIIYSLYLYIFDNLLLNVRDNFDQNTYIPL